MDVRILTLVKMHAYNDDAVLLSKHKLSSFKVY